MAAFHDSDPAEGAPAEGASADARLPEGLRLFQDNIGFVSRTLRHLGVDDADLEDLCQDVFLVAHRRRHEFEGRASARTWLYRICWNTAANHRRRAATRRRRTDPLSDTADGPPQEEDLCRKRSREQLAALLDLLDDDKRAIFVLYEIEQLSMREVVEIVGCPVQTGYSRLKAAHEIVRAAASRMSGDTETGP